MSEKLSSGALSGASPSASSGEGVRGTRYYRGLAHASIRRPVGTLAIASVVLVLVLGLFFVDRLAVNLLPEIVYPTIRVTVNYPGVAPEVMEEQVTRVLERALAGTEHLTRIHSRASEGRTNVNLEFEYGVNLDFALQDAARLMELARTQLPADIDPPRLYKFDPSRDPVYQAGFSSAARSPREVRDWVEHRLVPQLLALHGIAGVEAGGGLVRELEVVVDQERLRSYGISLQDVAAALARENLNIAAGQVTSETFDVMARTDGRFRSPADVAAVLIGIPGSERRIRLDEVAEVRDGYRDVASFQLGDSPAHIERENQGRILRVNGDINTQLADVGSVMAVVEARLADLELPEQYALVFGGQWETIEETNRELTTVILLAVFLVFVVLAVQYERLSNPLVIIAATPLAVVGGLLTAMLLTLFLVPCLYVIAEGSVARLRRLLLDGDQEAARV